MPPARTASAASTNVATRSALDNATLARVVRRLRAAYRTSQAPVVTLIATSSRDPYRVLTSCILSLRTQDATTAAAAERLFAVAPDVHALAAADPKDIEKLIYPVGFYRTKAPRLVEMARRIVTEFAGRVPDDIDTLVTFHGVGRKTANLVVGAGYQKPAICVDTHVHRISNRLGYVRTRTPDQTETALRATLPARYWLEYNDLLVSYGQTVCKPVSPLCSTCTIRQWCLRIGVTTSR